MYKGEMYSRKCAGTGQVRTGQQWAAETFAQVLLASVGTLHCLFYIPTLWVEISQVSQCNAASCTAHHSCMMCILTPPTNTHTHTHKYS